MQNFYNIANRADAAVLAATAEQHIAYVPYFPLGGFSPLQSDVLESVASGSATPIAVAESWLLQHSPNIMIPGTTSVDHLRENIAGAAPALPPDAVADLDGIRAADAGFKSRPCYQEVPGHRLIDGRRAVHHPGPSAKPGIVNDRSST